MKHLFELNKYFLRYKGKLLFGVVFVIAANFFRVMIPKTIRQALDYIFEKLDTIEAGMRVENDFMGSFGYDLMKFSFMIIGFALLMGVCMYIMRQTIIVISRLIEYDMRKDLFAKYESLDLSFYKTQKTGDLMSRISEDVNKVRMYLGPAILYTINITSLSVLVIYSMFQVNASLSFYTLLPLPILSITIYYVSSYINKRSEIIQRQLAKLNSIAQEVYSGIRVVKSYSKEKQFQNFFDGQSEDFKNKSMNLAKVHAFFHPLMILLISISSLVTIYIGGLYVSKGLITPGNLAEFVIYVNYLTWPFTSIGWIASIVQQAEASQFRINEFMKVDSKIENEGSFSNPIKGEIEFKNVNFTYPETGIQALENISFKLEAGKRLAIVGKTASGKSTIAELLLRMYDVDSGEILVDGINVKEHDLGHLRNRIGYIPQDVFLFSDSIQNNIAFGKNNASKEEAIFYAEKAAIDGDIKGFEKGYETLVGERGVTLSGGQKQRISIARAFIKKPDVVIMDDSLSAVDAKTEHLILGYLDQELKNKSAIIITHRFFNLFRFDHILVLENGQIIESGTHEELVRKQGNYFDLFSSQMQTTI